MNPSTEQIEHAEEGKIGDHSYQLTNILDDVLMSGDVWALKIPEAPNAAPVIQIAKQSKELNPINDPEFRDEALRIASEFSLKVRARISIDWTRRSTKLDAVGSVRRPIRGEKSKDWYCWHCDGQITGQQIADNLWHCPACNASPLDIFASPFLQNDQNNQTNPVEDAAMTCMTAPFAWPKIGEIASSTSDYTKMLLDAYEQHGTVTR